MTRWLHGLLAALIAAPFLVFGFWRDGEAIAVVLYRQPKAATLAVLGWLFLAVFFWSRVRDPRWEGLTSPLRRLELGLLAAFLGWMSLTLLWVRVPANALFELQQYLLLALVLVVLVGWQREDGTVARTVRHALLAALAVATAVGLAQLVVDFPWLRPINPEIGAPNPSTMGYKNPMALALLGQLYLLLDAATAARGWKAWVWRGLVVAELAYLATLGSRTSLAAAAVSGVWLLVLATLRAPRQQRRRRIVAGALVLATFVAVVALHPVGRTKASSVLGFVANPTSYLDSDRGIYLRNTLNMVRHNPWGVGLGDWQTHYPVYRLHGREVAFTDTHQVRRAHSDPVQFLGEGGWPALILWTVFLGLLITRSTLAFWRGGGLTPLFLSAQLVAFAVAMSTDYWIEMPVGKLQFFLVVALVLGYRQVATTPDATRDVEGSSGDRTTMVAVAILVSLVGVAVAALQVQSLQRTLAGAAIQQGYQAWTAGRPGGDALLARRLQEHGPTFLRAVGVTKSTHRDLLVVAHATALAGRRDDAVTLTELCLELHPFYPPAYELMAHLALDGETAAAWRQAHRHILDEATQGFEIPMPSRLARVGP